MKSFLSAVFTLLILAVAPLRAADDPALIKQGRANFESHCVRCHGDQGKGDGPDAKRLTVVPRDLTEGTFKFQSTAQGTPPSDEDLMWILNHGMSGAGMPSFGNLSIDAKKSLVAYIKTLSPIFQSAPEPLAAPKIKSKVDLAKGKELFAKLQCALCHGEEGRANGSSAAALKDKWERPIKPADLTQGWTYRAGDSAVQIYYRLMAGINGAPMPSYAEAVSPDDAWQLASYVQSLQVKPHWKLDLAVEKVKGELPTKGDEGIWAQAPRTDVNLQGVMYQGQKRDPVTVRAVHVSAIGNDEAIAFRFFWDDPTENRSGRSDSFLFAMVPKSFKGKGVNNLHNLYFEGAEPVDVYLWNASNPNVVRQVVSSVAAATRGQVRFSNELKAQATYTSGMWTLTFVRPKNLKGADSITAEDSSVRIGFAAWDGGNNEGDLKRSSSKWITLNFKDEQPHH